jgi:hypothetical protein
MHRVKGNGSFGAEKIAIVTVIAGSAGEASRSRESGFFRRKANVDL